jgi:hypothetical protein
LKRIDCLKEAIDLVTGQRAIDYGDATESHERIAHMWNCYLRLSDSSISAQNVAVMMILLKIVRLSNRPTPDGFVDICGYAALASEMGLDNC